MSGEFQIKSGSVMSKYCQVTQFRSWIGEIKSSQGQAWSSQIRSMSGNFRSGQVM